MTAPQQVEFGGPLESAISPKKSPAVSPPDGWIFLTERLFGFAEMRPEFVGDVLSRLEAVAWRRSNKRRRRDRGFWRGVPIAFGDQAFQDRNPPF
jgi:hypothetical protein